MNTEERAKQNTGQELEMQNEDLSRKKRFRILK